MNYKFFSSSEIYAMLASTYKQKIALFNKIDIMRWCADLTSNTLKDPAGLLPIRKEQLTLNNGQCVLPDNIFKLEGVYNEYNSLLTNFTSNGSILTFSDINMPKKVFIDYYKLMIDDEGFPMVKRGYESAMYAWCVYKMFEEDSTAIPPRIAQWKWLQICQDKDYEIEAAARSWDGLTDNEIKEIHNIMISPDYMRIVYGSNNELLDGGMPYGYNPNI